MKIYNEFISNRNYKEFLPKGKKYNINIEDVIKQYPILISPYYYGLINFDNVPDDPIWKQCIPSNDELLNTYNLKEDGLGENMHVKGYRIIHKYKDRVVLLVTDKCAVHCRFCFRKRCWPVNYEYTSVTDKELEEAISYIKSDKRIKEVLISGGDPLTLPADRLFYILNEISNIPQIETMRIGTRIPVVYPELVTKELVDMLKGFSSLWIVTHFNHPKEITDESVAACKKFIYNGIPVLNQTVLLAGINNDSDTLEQLFRGLIKIKVKPYYLFHIDPVQGVQHFATGIKCGLDILRRLRRELSSIAIPTYAIDLPCGGGKVPLQPNYQKDSKFETIDGKYIKYPFN